MNTYHFVFSYIIYNIEEDARVLKANLKMLVAL